MQHGGIEREADVLAQRRQCAPRILADVCTVDHDATDPPVELGLLAIPDVVERRRLTLGEVARHDARRMAQEMNVDALLCPVERESVDHVMRHVLHVEMRFALRDGSETARGHLSGVALACSENLVPHRVVEPGGSEIGCIKWLVPDREIGARAEGVHHRGREIPRTGPHGYPHGPDAMPMAALKQLSPSRHITTA